MQDRLFRLHEIATYYNATISDAITKVTEVQSNYYFTVRKYLYRGN